MRFNLCVAGCAALLVTGIGFALPIARADGRLRAVKVVRQIPENAVADAENAALKPEVAALVRKSTAVYSVMKSYRHNSEYFSKMQDADNEPRKTTVYTLALQRPNKFCYKADNAIYGAAVCDGKTFINHRIDNTPAEREHTYYTKTTAPATYKGINIVDDITFTYGTYFVALMLQGDLLADKDVRAGLARATLQANVEENGKKYDVLTVPFPGHTVPVTDHILHFYFDTTTHLLHKAVEDVPVEESRTQAPYKVLEIIENVLIDKPLPPGTFDYKLPKNARQVVGLPQSGAGTVAVAR